MELIDEVVAFSRDYINRRSNRTPERKKKIRDALKSLTGELFNFGCSTCYIEALFKILNHTNMATPKGYELKKGVLLQAFGDASKTCTNLTLTDELAEWYLKNYPEKAVFFEKIPVNPVIVPPIKIIPKEVPQEEKVTIQEKPVEEVAESLIESVTKPKKTGRKPSKAKK